MNVDEITKKIYALHGKMMRDSDRQILEISRGEMAVLGCLTKDVEYITPTELSTRFNISTARIANTLNSLEKKGYIVREHDRVDRRKVIVYASDIGKKYYMDVEKDILEHTKKLVEYLGEDAEKYYELQSKVYEYLH